MTAASTGRPAGPAAEWRAARDAAVLADLSSRGKLRLTGRDRAAFLQGLLTNDVASLRPGDSAYAVLADAHGRCLADLWVHADPAAWLLETEPGVEAAVRETLERYRVIEEVDLEPVTEAYTLLALEGPRAREVLAAAGIAPPCAGGEAEAQIAGAPVRIVPRPRVGPGGVDLWIAAPAGEAVREALLRAGAGAGLRPAAAGTFEGLRVAAGVARFGADFGPDVLPLEAGLLHAISFRKGCYVGQEAIAKLHYRGRPRRHLVRLALAGEEEAPDAGTELFAGAEKAGTITSGVRSPLDGAVRALGWVSRGLETPGSALATGSPGGRAAEVTGAARDPAAAGVSPW